MKITKRRLRKILLESLLLESRKTREWIKTQPKPDQTPLLDAYNKGLTVIDKLSWIQKTRGTEPIQDVVPDVIRFFEPQVQAIVRENGYPTNLSKKNYKTVNDLRRVLSQVDALIDSRKSKPEPTVKTIDDPNQVEKIDQVGPWTILLPKTVKGSTACDISGKDTSWCTTKTKGQNLFLSYVGREKEDIILFYVMDYSRTPDDPFKVQKEPFMDNNDSRISIGFVHGSPTLTGQDGSLSVDAANKGIKDHHLRSEAGLGQYYDKIMGILKAEAQVIGSNHPAKESFKRACQDILYLKSVIKDYGEDEKRDYIEQISASSYEKSQEVFEFIFFYDPIFLLHSIKKPKGENSGITLDTVERVYRLITSSSNPIDAFKENKSYAFKSNSKRAIKDIVNFILIRQSHLLAGDFFQKYLVLHTQLTLGKTNVSEDDIDYYFEELVDEVMEVQHLIFPPHPNFASEINKYESDVLSEKGVQNIIDNSKSSKYDSDYRGLRTVESVYTSSQNEELKSKFFTEVIEHRFNYFLKIMRRLVDFGFLPVRGPDGKRRTLPRMTDEDGLATGLMIRVLSMLPSHNVYYRMTRQETPVMIQELENAIDEHFPEFFQMSLSEFYRFIEPEGGLKGREKISKYAHQADIDIYIEPLLTGEFAQYDANSAGDNPLARLLSYIAASNYISERAIQHFKKHFLEYHDIFIYNKVKCDDQFLLDKYNSMELKTQEIKRYRADGSVETITRPVPDDIKTKIADEIKARISEGIWSLDNDVLHNI